MFIYGFETFGLAQAEAYREGMVQCFELLAATPRLGRKADQFSRFLHDLSADLPAFAGFCAGIAQEFKSGADKHFHHGFGADTILNGCLCNLGKEAFQPSGIIKHALVFVVALSVKQFAGCRLV